MRFREILCTITILSTMGYVRIVAGTLPALIKNYLTAESFTCHCYSSHTRVCSTNHVYLVVGFSSTDFYATVDRKRFDSIERQFDQEGPSDDQ